MTLIDNDDRKKMDRDGVMDELIGDSSHGRTGMVAHRGYAQLRDAVPAVPADNALSPITIYARVLGIGHLFSATCKSLRDAQVQPR